LKGKWADAVVDVVVVDVVVVVVVRRALGNSLMRGETTGKL